MIIKYECKRCGEKHGIKVPNCQKCSSCAGYNKIIIPQTMEEEIKYNFAKALQAAVTNSNSN